MQVEERAQPGRGEEAPRRSSSATSMLAVAVSIVALAAVGLGARALAEFEWDRVVDYRSPYLFQLEPGRETPPLTDELVIVVVDGLRVDVARDLPTFRAVAADGSFLVARAAQPSLSLPGWTLLTTGAPPEISGVTTNCYEGPVRVDSLFTAAQRAGVTTAIVGSASWEPLYGDVVTEGWFEAGDHGRSDEETGRQAIRIIRRLHPELLLVHLPDVDNVGHALGVGPEYLDAARRADAVIAGVLEEAGRDATVILTSDHGHVDAGGHGGPEEVVVTTPLVVAGPGTAVGASGEISQADVAPTAAALLGLSRPTHAIGSVKVGLLDAGAGTVERIRNAHRETEEAFFSRAAGELGGRATDAAGFRRVQAERARREALIRLGLTVIPLLVAAFAVAFATRRLHGGAMALGVLAFLGAWAGLFFGRGLTLSFSHFNTMEQIQVFLLARLVDTVIVALAAGLFVGVVAGRGRAGRGFQHGIGVSAWIMLVLAALVGAFVVVYGWGFTWRLPNLTAAFAQYLALLAMLGVGLGATLVGLVSLGAAWLAKPRG